MIYPLIPVFLSSVLGAGALALGLIEGIAESTAAFFKVLSGYWTDRTYRRRPFIIAGYGVSGFVRPLIAFASGWPFVLATRFLDRIGKGVRTSPPRDALIADITEPGQRGAAFGLQRAMDHAGAVAGPLVSASLLLFTLGNSTDAFLILRLSEAGVSASHIAILWSAHSVIKMISTYAGGQLSDNFGSRKLIIAGWVFYAFTYAAFAFVNTPNLLTAIFLLYGIYFGLSEPSEKSLVADIVPLNFRGTAFGYYHFTLGLGALPASLLFGLLWHAFSAEAAFLTGAALAIFATILILRSPIGYRGAENENEIEKIGTRGSAP